MDTVSLVELIEQAASDPNRRNWTGSLEHFDELLRGENLARLEAEHRGVYAFLVFHPSADAHVAEYLREGTLAADSGPRVLAFFTLDETALVSHPSAAMADVDADTAVHLAYEMTRHLFSPSVPPPLPGVIFMGQLSTEGDAVYIPLGNLQDASGVRDLLRSLFSLAEQALVDGAGAAEFTNQFSRKLIPEGIEYSRSGKAPLGEWLAKSYRRTVDHGWELVTIVGGFLAGQQLT
ncbi:hypothetical protein [Streptomyces anulatus]|uniref:hypothetical protein n=1 Tax=Streptomyces anulatus TaxID=1892 RepID=UPI001C259A0E|nr:hypothetical protein [Streptomyces anulatus]